MQCFNVSLGCNSMPIRSYSMKQHSLVEGINDRQQDAQLKELRSDNFRLANSTTNEQGYNGEIPAHRLLERGGLSGTCADFSPSGLPSHFVPERGKPN